MKRIAMVGLLVMSSAVFAAVPLQDFKTLLSIPNDSAKLPELRRNADVVKTLFEKSGLPARLLEAKEKNVAPLVFAEWKAPGATQTILFYAHYDGVAVNPKEWTVTKPYQPVILSDTVANNGKPVNAAAIPNDNWRIYARSAADDKSGVIALISAVRNLKASGRLPIANLKFIIEGEEESGSEHLEALLKAHRALVQSDGWIIVDGGVHPSGLKTLIFGARGDMNLVLTVYGAKHALHSGEYGGWAPNPAMQLARLLSSMQDEQGRVLIPGFYNDVVPLASTEQAALTRIPSVDKTLKTSLGFKQEDTVGKTLAQDNNQPSLIIQSLRAGQSNDEPLNLIPATASAVVEIRLVKGNDWQRMLAKVIRHVQAQGYEVLDHAPTDQERARYAHLVKITPSQTSYNAERLSLNDPFAKQIIAVVQGTSSQPIITQPTDGGSLPLDAIKRATGAPAISIGLTNDDNDQHTANENIRLGHLEEGIKTLMAIMSRSA